MICNFSKGGFSLIFLNKAATGVKKFVDGFVDMDWETNRSRLIRYRPGDSLANPPSRISGEFVTAVVIKLVDALHQANVSFLNEIEKWETTVGVLFGNRNN